MIDDDHDIVKPMLSDKSSNARGTDRSYHSDFVCRMRLNKPYPLLLKACNLSQHLGEVTVHLTKISDGKTAEVLVYTMTNAFVSRVDIVPESENSKVTQVSSDSTMPLIEFAINYQSVDVVYKPNSLSGDQSGNVTSGPLTGLGGGQ